MKQRKIKIIAAFFITLVGWDIVFPTAAIALTGGPSQPEVQSFEPVGTTEMVDVFSGDFVYNIPLVDVEGFPINISYHSGVGMDDEASWVGLGWNINPGVVNRNMRGIPDDFQGNEVKTTTNIKENKTWGVNIKPTFEIFGKRLKFNSEALDPKDSNYGKNFYPKKLNDSVSVIDSGVRFEVPRINVTLGVTYNNYRGLGYEFSLNPQLSLYRKETSSEIAGFGMNFSASSFNGADVDANFSFSDKIRKNKKPTSLSFGLGMNSQQGLKDITFNYQFFKSTNKKDDKKDGRWKLGRGARFSVNPMSYTPQIQNELNNISANLALTLGPELFGWHGKLGLDGYFHTQYLKSQNKTNYAYGYMFSHDGADQYPENTKNAKNKNVMFDLNRENDGPFTKEKPLLSMPVFTYDLFNISGEGTGGLVRPFRSDVGVMYDATVKNTTWGLGGAAEFGLGNLAKWGADLSGNYGYSVSGPWRGKENDFDIIRHLGFKLPESGNSFEPFYLKSTGEKTLANNDLYSKMGSDEPVYIEVDNAYTGRLTSNLWGKSGSLNNIKSDMKYASRQRRNTAISSLTNSVSSKMALDRKIKLYQQNTFSITDGRSMLYDTIIERYNDANYDHLMSELTVTNPDGRRYVYGIPAYNYRQNDVSFRVVNSESPGSLVHNRATGMVNYSAGDNSTGNNKGEDNFYNKTEIPAYAHSFLISGILSPDYVDITGNGISDDDIGTSIKFNYTRAHITYNWRTPFGKSDHQANYDEGLKSDIYDDRANYIYGQKEIWYVHSIESKNYVACFYTSRRDDACQVLDEDGGIDTSASFYKLDSIKLFTKEELRVNGTNATPLKTVHFEYDYSLCPKVENNRNYATGGSSNTGKLTLKKIYFTYGKSQKGRTNSYRFTYSDYNPSYNLRGYDRWGNFKPNATKEECDDIANQNYPLSNVDDPYVLQNKDSADLYSSAWSLTQIKLPSGGVIEVDYESDDYAYVQDKQAGQMFKITGINNTTTFNDNAGQLYTDDDKNNIYLFFDLTEPISKTLSSNEIEKKKSDYFTNIANDKVYFKFLVDLTNKGDYDFVSGYADKHEYGFSSKNPSDPDFFDVGYVKLKEVPLSDRRGEINPITKAAWNFMRLYAPKKLAKIFSNYEMPPGSDDAGKALKSLVGSMNEMVNMANGFGKTMRNKHACQKFLFNKSFIRLSAPGKAKLGGGTRVKQLGLSDSWDEMVSGQESSTYGQRYIYTKDEKQNDGTYRTISSGVATWEPGIGNDENPHKLPVEYSGSNALAPNDQYLIEKPVGESLFPAPSIGYSQVTTVNIKPTENIKRTGTGKVVNEFYTAFDFPVITHNTTIDKRPKSTKLEKFLMSALKVYVNDRAFVSQGYSVELNDMHGKPKAQWVYQEDNPVPISGVKYEYQYVRNVWGQNQLTSRVDIMRPDGSISSGEIGREVDYMFDTRHFYSFNINGGMELNNDIFMAGVFPMLVSSLFGSITSQEVEFGSAVNTKVIMRYGILKATEVFEDGATVKTENVLFDSETGDVLLAKTTNEFNDTIYTFNYPAHFAYTGMGQAYKNLGYWFKDIRIENGELKGLANYTNFFIPGDEMFVEYEKKDNTTGAIERNIFSERIWAVESPHHDGKLIFMTRTGKPFNTNLSESGKTFTYGLTIIRSGRRNMQSASIGTVVSLNNPVTSGTLNFDSVINSGAVEFSDYWAAEHKVVFEAAEEGGGAYAGTGPAPVGLPPRGGCNDSCYNVVYDLLMALDPSYNTLLNTSIGDTINLMKPPYRNAFLCAIDQGSYCPQFDVFQELGDSLLIMEVQTNYADLNYQNEDDFRYAVLYPGKRLAMSELYAQRGPSVQDEFSYSPLSSTGFNKTFSSFSQQNVDPCNPCDLIRNRTVYKKRTFKLGNGCKLHTIVQCIVWPSTSCISYPKASTLNCNLSNSPLFSYETTIKTLNMSDPAPGSNTLYTLFGCDNAIVYTEKECPYKYGEGPYKVENDDTSGNDDTLSDGGIKSCRDSICDDSALLMPINPYVYGIRGNWKPKRNWLFYNKRNQATTTNIRKDGTYTGYADFWKKPTISGKTWDTGTTINSKWTWNTVVTQFNRTGNEVENMDALNIYSSALFGYGNSIVKAVANNARLRQIAFDGAEDYNYPIGINENHFSFRKHANYTVDTISHTGISSLALSANATLSVLNCVIYTEKENERPITDTTVNMVMLKPTEILDKFSPDTGKYIISAWVKENTDTAQYNAYRDTVEIKIYNNGCATTYKFTPSGPIIEGWQRVEGIFNIPDSATCIEVTLKSNGQRSAYFDDVRIHPWQANMKSFVYHPQTLRLMAELDENNYATFYEYDDEGRLVRIKRETERGIVTLQESRTGLKINY